MDLIIKGGRLVTPLTVFMADIGITDGRIERVARTINESTDEVFDAKGKLVFPGMIDPHVHVHDPLPPFIDREDFGSATVAAACGGLTTIIEMPTDTPLLGPAAIREKIAAGKDLANIDFALHAGNMTPEAIGSIGDMVREGITSFKGFLSPPYKLNDGQVLEFLREVERHDCTALFHCENGEVIDHETELRMKEGDDPVLHSLGRPNIAEEEAVARMCRFAGHTNTKLHVVHVSTREGAQEVARWRTDHAVTGEVCTHHLVFTRDAMREQGPFLKMNPPLRGVDDVHALWTALADGTLDMVATDHFSCFREEKEAGIWEAPSGVPGVETMVPLILSLGVNEGRLTLRRACEVLSTNAAKVFGLYPNKGSLQVGTDADLTIVDLKATKRITADDLHYRIGWTPYEGMTVRGLPVATVVRGKLVAQDGEFIGRNGPAVYLKR